MEIARPLSPLADAPFNLAEHCLAAANTSPDKIALEVIAAADRLDECETWTYAQLEDGVLRVAAGLTVLGLKPGQRIMIRLGNRSAYPIAFLACIAAGLVPIPTSDQLTDSEASFLLADSGAVAQLVDADSATSTPAATDPNVLTLSSRDVMAMVETAERGDYAPTRCHDPAYLIYTSGTTAHPKGVIHAHRVILGRQPMYHGWYAITDNDRMMHAGAFNWTYTLGTGLLDPWANGATAIIYTGDKQPALWPQLIAASRATIFAAVPGVMRQILKYAPPGPLVMPTLRHGLIAGEKPPADLFADWSNRTGTELYEALGMSELSTYISTAPSVPRKAGSTGKAQAGRRIAIIAIDGGVDPLPPEHEGLIAVDRNDPGLMLGYWQRPDEERDVFRGPWFIGGDIGKMDDDGYITHLGRANDVMKALGYRVSPQEVEAALATCPGVLEVACTALDVRADVTVVAAFIVRADTSALSADDVRDHAARHLAAYKCPREVVFVDALPRTANGKVRRRDLALAYQSQDAATS